MERKELLTSPEFWKAHIESKLNEFASVGQSTVEIYANEIVNDYFMKNIHELAGMKPDEAGKLDLKEMEQKADAAIQNITKESFEEWNANDEAGKTAEEVLDRHIGSIRAENKSEVWYEDAISAMKEYLYLNKSKQIKSLHQIENLMERWHHARDNDAETLQKINDELVGIGLLAWFNKDAPSNTEKRDQFGVKAESKDGITCSLCVYLYKNLNKLACCHCLSHNKINEYYISK